MSKIEALISTAGSQIRKFSADRDGATAIEYALIASGVGVAVAATVFALGSSVKALFTNVSGLM